MAALVLGILLSCSSAAAPGEVPAAAAAVLEQRLVALEQQCGATHPNELEAKYDETHRAMGRATAKQRSQLLELERAHNETKAVLISTQGAVQELAKRIGAVDSASAARTAGLRDSTHAAASAAATLTAATLATLGSELIPKVAGVEALVQQIQQLESVQQQAVADIARLRTDLGAALKAADGAAHAASAAYDHAASAHVRGGATKEVEHHVVFVPPDTIDGGAGHEHHAPAPPHKLLT